MEGKRKESGQISFPFLSQVRPEFVRVLEFTVLVSSDSVLTKYTFWISPKHRKYKLYSPRKVSSLTPVEGTEQPSV